jgi:multimeric flavodoxin WrbA
MAILILASSPNKDGLTAECAQAAADGITAAGGEAQIVWVNDENIGLCKACGSGWGTCLPEHKCQVQDGFQALHEKAAAAEGLVLVNPVYWGQLSESAKAFCDRLRRCEATRGEESTLKGKPAIGVAAAGGSGGGIVSCLDEMLRLFQHLRCTPFDMITVTRKSRGYKPSAIRAAAETMCDILSS